jgi:hypothetical protein
MTAIAGATAFLAAVRAVHPWIIVCLTTLPRAAAVSNQADRDAKNAELVTADNYMRANYLQMGIDRLVDIRQSGSPFALANYTTTSFDAISSLWNEGSALQIHCSPAGYGVCAAYVASVLAHLPKTAH